MSDDEIYKLCETKEGILEYMEYVINSNGGYDNRVYMNKSKIPLIEELLEKGILTESKGVSGVNVYQLKK